MNDLESFFKAISHAGMTLNLKKCEFANGEVRFVGHLIGSGQRLGAFIAAGRVLLCS